MSAKVFKQQSAVAFAAFQFTEIGAQAISPEQATQLTETFNFPETVDIEPFTEPESEIAKDLVLQNAYEQAARILAEAEEKYELIEQAARDKAMHEAQSAIETKVAERIEEFRENFACSIEEVESLRDEISVRVEAEVVELALEIAKKIIGREVMFDRDIALTLVKVSLKKIHSRAFARVHLNPVDYAFVQTRREQIDFRGALEFVEDHSISPGGCLIHTETGDVDATIESQFEEIAYGLLGK